MCPSPPLDASVPTARAKRYDLVAGCYPANATDIPQNTRICLCTRQEELTFNVITDVESDAAVIVALAEDQHQTARG